jgi:hypothetical protein
MSMSSSGSHVTRRWREMDSNSRSPVSGDTPQRPRIASPGIISAKSRLALRTKGFDPFAEILRASPESHQFLAKVPAPRRRDPPVPGFRKMRGQASGNSYLHGHRWGLGEQKANQAPESHRFLAKVPAPRHRDTPLPAFRKMRVQQAATRFPPIKREGKQPGNPRGSRGSCPRR